MKWKSQTVTDFREFPPFIKRALTLYAVEIRGKPATTRLFHFIFTHHTIFANLADWYQTGKIKTPNCIYNKEKLTSHPKTKPMAG